MTGLTMEVIQKRKDAPLTQHSCFNNLLQGYWEN